jgi:hypothetical protein
MPRDGLTFAGYLQPPSVPPDPIDEDWRGEPGPPGPPGDASLTMVKATGSSTPRSAADRFGEIANIKDEGALGDGSDATDAFEAAVERLRGVGGGVLRIPSGDYVVHKEIALPSNVDVRGDGATSRIMSSTLEDWTGAVEYALFVNDSYGGPGIDENISIENVGFSWDLLEPHTEAGSAHSVRIYSARNVQVRHTTSWRGGDAVALIKVENFLIDGNSSFEARNCPYDVWGASGDGRIVNNYAVSTILGGQILNLNAAVDAGVGSRTSLRGVIANNTLTHSSGGLGDLNIDALGTAGVNSVESITVAHNIITGPIHGRGDVKHVIIDGNIINYQGGNSGIFFYSDGADTPQIVTVVNNTLIDPATTAGNLGAIRIEANGYMIAGNTVTGTAHVTSIYTGAYVGVIGPNHVTVGGSGVAVTGSAYSLGDARPTIKNATALGLRNSNGTVNLLTIQGDDNLILSVENGAGSQRNILSIQARNTTAPLVCGVDYQTALFHRQSLGLGLTATGSVQATALALARQFNIVTTTAAGTGVVVPPSKTGAAMLVQNKGANALAVYPNLGAAINALGANNALSLAAGAAVWLLVLSATEIVAFTATLA